MRKASAALIISLVFLVVVLAFGGYFGYRLYVDKNQYYDYLREKKNIELLPPAEAVTEYTYTKDMGDFKELKEGNGLVDYQLKYSYQCDHIMFYSYTSMWNEDMLKSLSEELYKNTHGSEIDYLKSVTVYGDSNDEYIGSWTDTENVTYLQINMRGVLPEYFNINIPNTVGIIKLYGGDTKTTVEQMAVTLSHEYGHHYTLFYFDIDNRDKDTIADEYFKLRYAGNSNIFYTQDDCDDWNNYMMYHQWYLLEIAAEDYVYLMGSPTTRTILKYYDSKEQLSMQVRGQDDKLDAYYEEISEGSFNRSPHENLAIDLPDKVEGLAELFYYQIGLEPPVYEDRSDLANDITINIKKKSQEGYTYYNITWDKPWTSSDVTYTLVAFDEDEQNIGAIKSIQGNEDASANIGSVVVLTSHYIHYYTSDYWTDQGWLRFRVVVTFPDGTAVVSPYVDRSFS